MASSVTLEPFPVAVPPSRGTLAPLADSRSAVATAMDELRAASLALMSIPSTSPAPGLLHHLVMAAFHRLGAASLAAEAAGLSLERRRDLTAGARAFAARFSQTLAHAQRWPRGYPGDYQIIERLLDQPAAEATEPLEHAVEAAVLALPVVVQHRSKVAWQAGLVRRCLATTPHPRVLSVGCGGSRDLMDLESAELRRLAVVLNDADADALALSRARLEARVNSLICVPGNALRRTTQLAACGPYDLILIGGLLDYLPPRAARLVLGKARGLLAPGGLLGCTNIAAGNPWRPFMELVTSWPLIERTSADMLALFDDAGPPPTVGVDATRLTWLVTATPA